MMKVTLVFTPRFKEMPYKIVKIVGSSPVIDTSKPESAQVLGTALTYDVGIGTVRVGETLNEAEVKILGGFAELTTVLAGSRK